MLSHLTRVCKKYYQRNSVLKCIHCRFADVKVTGDRASTDKSTYSYNPCLPMASSAGCNDGNVAVRS